ncbi:MAG: MASE3 domain-containing protein, partial [Eubacteriales bacterium]|nr:MASE3 domain-containing protein [Eubacteriales bacterium]
MRRVAAIALVAAIASGLYLASLYSYLLFHGLVELFCVVIAFGIFMFAWNSRRFIGNNFLLFLGISYFFVGVFDVAHILAYRGMNIFSLPGANLAT